MRNSSGPIQPTPSKRGRRVGSRSTQDAQRDRHSLQHCRAGGERETCGRATSTDHATESVRSEEWGERSKGFLLTPHSSLLTGSSLRPRMDTGRRQGMMWRTAGRDGNGPATGTRHRLTDSKPVEPKFADPRSYFAAGGQSNQKQTHTQQPEQSHAVSILAHLWARRYLGRSLHADSPGNVIPRACWSR
jgi:hypothetical protein